MMLKKVFLVLTPAVLLVVLLLGIGAGSAAQAASSARALQGPRDIPEVISYWPLNSAEVIGTGYKYHDVIARANDVECSTSQDNCPVQVPGFVGNALLFDGVNDQLNKNASTVLSWQNADSFSVEAWVKLPSDNNCSSVDGSDVVVSNQVFIGRWRDNTPGNMTSWWLGCGWEKVEDMAEADEAYAIFHIRDSVSATGKAVFSDTVINDDQWHHVIGIYDGTAKEMRIFVDGSLENTLSPGFTGDFVTESRLQMGVYTINAAPGYYLDGALDEVAVYDKALTQADIDQLRLLNIYLPLIFK